MRYEGPNHPFPLLDISQAYKNNLRKKLYGSHFG